MKYKNNRKELDWAERLDNILGNREDLIKQLVGKIPEDKIIEGLKYFDETKRQLGELIQSLLTQQRTELLEEIMKIIEVNVHVGSGYTDECDKNQLIEEIKKL